MAIRGFYHIESHFLIGLRQNENDVGQLKRHDTTPIVQSRLKRWAFAAKRQG